MKPALLCVYVCVCARARSVRCLLVTANVPSSKILVILTIVLLGSSETSVLTSVMRCNFPEDGILHSQCRGNLTSGKYVSYLRRIACDGKSPKLSGPEVFVSSSGLLLTVSADNKNGITTYGQCLSVQAA
jgi:hypothetical protein